MFSNCNKTIFTVAIMAIFSFLTLGCSGDDNGGVVTQQSNFVDNDKIFPDYEYPKSGGVTKDYLMNQNHCNDNILIEAVSDSGLKITDFVHAYFNIKKGSIIPASCHTSVAIGQDICNGNNEATISVDTRQNHIVSGELVSKYKIDGAFIACGTVTSDGSGISSITNLFQNRVTNGYLALHVPEYITEVKLAHFKKFATLVHDNNIHSPSYQQFKDKCNLFSNWNLDKFAEQEIDREKCRDLFMEYGNHYTTFSGFSSQKYENLPNTVKVLDIIASFDKLPGDPEYYMVSA